MPVAICPNWGVLVEAETSHSHVIGMGKILKWENRAVMHLSDIQRELRANAVFSIICRLLKHLKQDTPYSLPTAAWQNGTLLLVLL